MAPNQAWPGPTAPALEPCQPAGLPVLYSFRRCPYAIRARLALAAAGLVPKIDLEVREVSLACKPPELLLASPKGSVPVLVLPPGAGAKPGATPVRHLGGHPGGEPGTDGGGDGSSKGSGDGSGQQVIDQSLALMTWALGRHDPGDWLRRGSSPAAQASRDAMAALIAENDGPFKHHLDRFKYPDRFKPKQSHGASLSERDGNPGGNKDGDSGGTTGGKPMGEPALNALGPSDSDPGLDRQRHRAAALTILGGWNRRLGSGNWLLGPSSSLADWALLPFVRQFRRADPAGFDAEPDLAALKNWLQRFEHSPELAAVMADPWGQRQPWQSPRWLYHLALPEEWRQARAAGVYARSTRGLGLEQVGFIHASYAHQLAATYARFYDDCGPVVLLTIDPGRLDQAGVPVRAEPAGPGPAGSAERFPHLYGPLPLTAVLAAAPYQP